MEQENKQVYLTFTEEDCKEYGRLAEELMKAASRNGCEVVGLKWGIRYEVETDRVRTDENGKHLIFPNMSISRFGSLSKQGWMTVQENTEFYSLESVDESRFDEYFQMVKERAERAYRLAAEEKRKMDDLNKENEELRARLEVAEGALAELNANG